MLLVFDPVEVRRNPRDDAAETSEVAYSDAVFRVLRNAARERE
jgi:hypothetical protein